MRKWTVEDAKACVEQVENGKAPSGLKYCSAKDFLRKVKEGN